MFSTANLSLSEPIISARGAKSCALTDGQDGKVLFQLGSAATPTSTPFGASSFNEEASTRKTIDFRLTPEQDEAWKAFDDWAVAYLAEHSERLFKRKQSADQIREHYRSPVTRKEGYAALLRCKLNSEGRAAVRAWDRDGGRTSLPQDLRGWELVPRLQLSHLWIMGRDFGFVINTLDILVQNGAAETECPFALPAPSFGGP